VGAREEFHAVNAPNGKDDIVSDKTPDQIKRHMVLAAIAAIILTIVITLTAVAQDADPTPIEPPTIEEPEIPVDNPDSNIPDNLQNSSLPQLWHVLAAGIATGLASTIIRWWPIGRWPVDPEKQHDIKVWVGGATAVIVAFIGAILNGDIDNTTSLTFAVGYVVAEAWLLHDKMPFTRQLSRAIAGKPAT
jgi:hypothetical protein